VVQHAFDSIPKDVADSQKRYELAKLNAEINQIISDTSGSLFWIKFIGLLMTVTGAVVGYVVGQSENTKRRIKAEEEQAMRKLNFEHRKDVDTAYQAIVQELSDEKPVLRAAAAVKLGAILKTFPAEWEVGKERKEQLIQLTKEVLAAALSIEKDLKVLKTITIALVLDKSIEGKIGEKKVKFSNVKNLDLSGAKAQDAYWAKADFSYADFFKAELQKTSFRDAILTYAQFREANLRKAVLVNAICENANFEGAKVYDMNLQGAILTGVKTDVLVDVSENDDAPVMMNFGDWLREKKFNNQTA
jgi:hypothetical protein